MRPWALLPLLEQHHNLGCYVEFGRAGTIAQCARLLNMQRESFRFRLELDALGPDDEKEMTNVVLAVDLLHRKGITTDMIFRLIGSRVFMRTGAGGKTNSIYFLHEPEEVVVLLRENLAFLRGCNDESSRTLYAKLTKIQEESEWADKALCLDLNRMREESVEHIRKLLGQAPDRRKAVEALDRGEALSFLEERPAESFAVSDLSDHDISFLVSIVRARYVLEVLSRKTANKSARLTPLGEKLFGGRPASDFSPRELRQVLVLATRAFEKPLSPLTSLAHASDSLVT